MTPPVLDNPTAYSARRAYELRVTPRCKPMLRDRGHALPATVAGWQSNRLPALLWMASSGRSAHSVHVQRLPNSPRQLVTAELLSSRGFPNSRLNIAGTTSTRVLL